MKAAEFSLKRELTALVTGAWLRPPVAHQVAALCWRRAGEGHEVLLLTTRGRGQWMVPKGWPKAAVPDAEMAAAEAYEEAGVRGTLNPVPVGTFHYEKRIASGTVMECAATVYALEVHEHARTFPEAGEREVAWFSPGEAAAKVACPELSALLTRFEP
ncbi:NUDIX hydrolase [Hyphomonas johnsonii]|uniref:NUDIX hydrolase n=1 Tax=Hyphomonas johnsonii MHS-2 TaxID=1280950 RepID=A0A059FJS1_9PROT|nr:NUDIX domain-containing protein [Hyphomonas johnsonii]KCZ90728.1 NUDIX hydrolase [Hyphomonas johnsonii MHS-2]